MFSKKFTGGIFAKQKRSKHVGLAPSYVLLLGNNFDIYRGENENISPDWNTYELKKLGCDYIISGVNIENADSLGLKLLNEEPLIADEDSYAIRIYEINGD